MPQTSNNKPGGGEIDGTGTAEEGIASLFSLSFSLDLPFFYLPCLFPRFAISLSVCLSSDLPFSPDWPFSLICISSDEDKKNTLYMQKMK